MHPIIIHHILHGSPSVAEAYHAGQEPEPDHLSNEHFARNLMSHPDFLAYIHAHGYHFTPELADHVTRHHLVNADGSSHHWTTAQVQSALQAAGMKDKPLNMTWGDASFLANWFYSDEYPDTLSSESAVIRRTYRAAQDPDGYEGMTFSRWLSDVIGHRINIDWASFV